MLNAVGTYYEKEPKMQFLAELWLPILVASVVLFFLSAFAWMRAAGETNQIGRAPNGTSLDRHRTTFVRNG